MMDWGSGFWYILIIAGVITFFVIAFILLYIMRKGTRNLEALESSVESTKTKELRSNRYLTRVKFCPECGVELNEQERAYCPACGHKFSIKNEE
jgi:hypothetical protein